MARIACPVADLRLKPQQLEPFDFAHHDLRDSQLLYNEEVEVLESRNEWVRVRASEQGDLKGWVHATEIDEWSFTPRYVAIRHPKYSYGTLLEAHEPGTRPLPAQLDRAQLVREALLFLGAPYLWGGRSSYLHGKIASVDCSGLINLLYRAQGIAIPRNAHEQWEFGKPTEQLQPGDPLYLAREERVTHVILYISKGLFIEAPETGKRVRILKWGCDVWEEKGRLCYRDREGSYLSFQRTFM